MSWLCQNGIFQVTHPVKNLTDSIDLKLSINSACDLVSLGHFHLMEAESLEALLQLSVKHFPVHAQGLPGHTICRWRQVFSSLDKFKTKSSFGRVVVGEVGRGAEGVPR